MNCGTSFYLCSNLIYWDESDVKGYRCTLTGRKCSCQNANSECSAFEEAKEE